jgi:glycogen debranching enzyme
MTKVRLFPQAVKLHADELDRTQKLLQAFEDRPGQNAVGSIGETFDAEPPYPHRGCVAQAWSVAEVLRGLVKIMTLNKHAESGKPA